MVAVYEAATEWSEEWVLFDAYVDGPRNIKLRSQLQQELGHADLFVLETVHLHGAVSGAVGVQLALSSARAWAVIIKTTLT